MNAFEKLLGKWRAVCRLGPPVARSPRPAKTWSHALRRQALSAGLLIFAAGPAAAAGIHASIEPGKVSVASNGLFTADLTIFQADAQFNGFEAIVLFDHARLRYVPGSNQVGSLITAACGSQFKVFKADTAQAADPDTLEISVSMLCPNVFVTGPGVIYRVQFRAKNVAGGSAVSYGSGTKFYRAGLLVSPLETRQMIAQVDCPAITVSPTTLPGGTVKVAYSQTISASGGSAPHTFTLGTGALPAGLTLSSGGVLSGTPTAAGTSTFTVKATDTQGCQGDRSYSITIVCTAISIAPATLPGGTPKAPYSQTLTASGGTAPYAFVVTSGALPAGLTLSSGGVISGTPTGSGTSSFTVKATDANGCSGTQSYSIAIVCPALGVGPLLPNGTVKVPYDAQLTSDGSPPFTFVQTGGALPAGIVLEANGRVHGSADLSGKSDFTVQVTDHSGCTGTGSISLTISCVTISVGPAVLPNGTVKVPYDNQLTSDGSPPFTFVQTGGALPAGIVLDPDGRVHGSVDLSGKSDFTVQVTDHSGCTGTGSISLTINCVTLTVGPATLPDGTVKVPYDAQLTSDGSPPLTFVQTGGSLPAGIVLDPDGRVHGSADLSGKSSFTVQVTDHNGCTGTGGVSLTINCVTLSLGPATLPNGTVKVPYEAQLTSGGSAPWTFMMTGGALPAGIALDANGHLSGTPNPAGTFTFTVVATDHNGCHGSRGYVLTICPVQTLSPPALPGGTVGTAYSQALTASGGTSPSGFALTAGALPPGLTLSGGGVISGTPTAAGSFDFTVTATDANGCPISRDYTLTIVVSSVEEPLPSKFAIGALAPNPRIGQASGRVLFGLPEGASVRLDMFDIHGRVVASREPEAFSAGRHVIVWDLPNLPSGTYLFRLGTSRGAVGHRLWVVLR